MARAGWLAVSSFIFYFSLGSRPELASEIRGFRKYEIRFNI